jgi:hypothetical protein
MASENFPTAENPKPVPPTPPKSNLRSFIIGALLIALLATWGYIIWDKNKNEELVASKDKIIAKSTAESDTLQSLLAEATNRYDSIKTSSAKKDSALTAKDKLIAEKQSKIQSILSKENATKEELAQAKTMIASLNQDIDGYKAQIETLKAANTQLTADKQTVTAQRDIVQKSFDSTQQVVKQKEDVIDIGSTLHASNFNILGIDQKSNGQEKETSNFKKVNKLRISFDLDENLISQSGPKTLYVCITGPDGKPIADEDSASAIFTTRDNQQLPFTQRMDVNYVQAKRQTISFDWKQKGIFSIGDYKIEVYNNGFKIGQGVTHLKKGGLFG